MHFLVETHMIFEIKIQPFDTHYKWCLNIFGLVHFPRRFLQMILYKSRMETRSSVYMDIIRFEHIYDAGLPILWYYIVRGVVQSYVQSSQNF